ADAAADAARARLADARRTVGTDVVRAYAAAALAEANAVVARRSAGLLGDEARIAEVRWHAGDISRSERDQIEVAATRLELDAGAAAAAARAQRIALEQLLGMPGPEGLSVVADSLEDLAARADVEPGPPAGGPRADLAAARADLRAADAELRLQLAERVPDPTLFVQAEHAPPDRPNSLGGGVSLPLPLWNRNGAGIAAARAALEQADRAARRAEAQIAADVAAARARYDEARARWHRYRDDIRPRAAAIRESVSLAYEKGGASLLDLLEAERTDNDVRLAAMQAASDVTVAAAELRAAQQPLTPEDSPP
ncbi:MAG TPA: TolC family protein, partial [Candidatus Eisenbacteria bacterium]|nr:TolC family protein [Candidatus Eisenbacteria bacterium]